ncbi:MAG: hypothetical protein ACJ8AT_17750 [Hyalangium sp.]|uniref:hypothetical protein n=1 Tax=Hyalangium sp. TaxID=2028555 RepID=UPI00389ABBFB
MTEKTKRPEWMKAFFPPPKEGEATYSALFDLGRASLLQAATAQRTALEFYRQFTEGDGDERSLRAYQEGLLRKMLEAMDPFFAIEQPVRQQALKAQAALLDLCEESLHGFLRYNEERNSSKST